jgi:hypothetical protein
MMATPGKKKPVPGDTGNAGPQGAEMTQRAEKRRRLQTCQNQLSTDDYQPRKAPPWNCTNALPR